MVEKGANLDSIHQLRNSANMIAMVVRNQDIIDLREAGLMRGSQDPIGVAAFISRPAGIDEQRLSRWTHHQSRLPAFHVDEIYLQRFAAGGLSSLARQNHDTKGKNGN